MRMKDKAAVTALLPLIALLAACGGGSDEANEVSAAGTDSNIMLEQPGNDASALEAAANADPFPTSEPVDGNGAIPSPAPAPTPSPAPSGGEDQPVLGETSGGDTGGNTVQGNMTGQ
jgi:hypothetical protein